MALREKKTGSRASPKSTPLPFSEAVMRAVRAIPRGEVRSYAQVALYAGRPGAARGVGHELKVMTHPHSIPWWRVTRAGGVLAPPVAQEQARRLRAEGVEVQQRGEGFRVKAKR
ncbi:MGMT family protein [Hyalangium sp.]|uniref:MGMT family protein n=1 Tax=Hyalangium sp. TaxID=2028555 RepID=UPI002D272CDE|nr:MGMT family protein [Hyalangium sp.]HYH97125.1 MGMT family protein [Hyalangium sp.]